MIEGPIEHTLSWQDLVVYHFFFVFNLEDL
jgi:hypothetical protein